MPPRKKAIKIVENDPPNSTQLGLVNRLKVILARQYFKQLQLEYVNYFVDPNSKLFLEDVDVFEIDTRIKNEALILAKEQRSDIFLNFINKLVSSNRFVGSLAQSILELILTVNQKYDETMEQILLRIKLASLLFENIIDNFPPTWSYCSTYYKKLLYNPMEIEIDYKKIRANASDGFFRIILALLDDVLKDGENNANNSNAFDSMMNFQQFERIQSEMSTYLMLSRDEKIDRIFIVLHLLVKLMEIDTNIWVARYPFQTKKHMCNTSTCPLIVHLLWKGKDCGEMNIIIRDILKIFMTCLWIDFPDDKIDILARLVNLIATAVNLSENNDNDNLISYPNIQRLNDAFASEVIKNIECFPYTVEFYLHVISKMRSPIIRMLISTRLLSKFNNRDFEKVSLKKIFENISNETWMQYEESVEVEDVVIRGRVTENYPIYDPFYKKKSSRHLAMSSNEYLDLLLHLFKSYIEVYQTGELLRVMVSEEEVSNSNNEAYKSAITKSANEKNHRFDFPKLLKDWKGLNDKAMEFANADIILVPKLEECENVYVDASLCLRCEEDLLYLVKLKEIIDKNVKLSDHFKKWHSFISHLVS